MKKKDGFLNEYLFVLPCEWIKSARDNKLFSFLRVTDIGYFPRALHHYRERVDGCDTAILLYCRDGNGTIKINANVALTLEPGQAVLIPPNTSHSYSASQQNPWSVYWVHLEGDILSSYLNMIGDNIPLHVPTQFGDDIVREFHRCFKMLKAPYQTEEYFLVCQSAGNILAMVSAAEKHHKRQLTEKGENAVEKCIRHMKANLSSPLNLEHLADISGFSPSHLNVLFKQSTGHAPIEYFLHMKMQAASKELYFTKRPVKEIAVDYGVPDPYYFSRLFKKVMGVSPIAYRQRAIG